MGISGFLKEVVALKKNDVAESERITPMKLVRQNAENILKTKESGYRPPFAFLHAIEKSRAGHVGIIAEIKKASPSKGDIRPDLDPAVYAEKYTKAGACAISVLTEQHYFKGSLDDLKAVRNVTSIPVLRKDFTLSSYQIYEAKAAGADSVLLIVAMLSKEQLRDYVDLSRELGMEPLVEINSEWELDKAMFANAKIIGINNRNLQTLEVDHDVARRVVPFFAEGQIAVEASGISSSDDIQKGLDCKIFNFLVGESIVRAENTEEFIQSLVRTESKDLNQSLVKTELDPLDQ
ncbi:MAG: indole-3-glycerol phosphate synthase TrpC, partial [Desulfamplus sp.]|nr:indole-3-glycerol phosphate synthase TrpC [Desulfamplus sp.]